MMRALIFAAAAMLAPSVTTTAPTTPPADVLIVAHDPLTGTTERVGYLDTWHYSAAQGGFVMYLEYHTELDRLFVNGFEVQP